MQMASAYGTSKAQMLPRQPMLRAPKLNRASSAALRPKAWLFPDRKATAAKPATSQSATPVLPTQPKVHKLPLDLLKPGTASAPEHLSKAGLLSGDLVFRPSTWQRLNQQQNQDAVQRSLQGAAAYLASSESWDAAYPDRIVEQSWVAQDESTGEAFVMSVIAPGEHPRTHHACTMHVRAPCTCTMHVHHAPCVHHAPSDTQCMLRTDLAHMHRRFPSQSWAGL